jgi:hypothetical protein
MPTTFYWVCYLITMKIGQFQKSCLWSGVKENCTYHAILIVAISIIFQMISSVVFHDSVCYCRFLLIACAISWGGRQQRMPVSRPRLKTTRVMMIAWIQHYHPLYSWNMHNSQKTGGIHDLIVRASLSYLHLKLSPCCMNWSSLPSLHAGMILKHVTHDYFATRDACLMIK